MHIDEYKLIQKEIDEQNISIIDYAKKHGIKLGTLYRGLQNAKKYGEPIMISKLESEEVKPQKKITASIDFENKIVSLSYSDTEQLVSLVRVIENI